MTVASRRPSSRGSAAPGEKPAVTRRSRRKRGWSRTLLDTAASRSPPGSSNGASSRSSQSGSGVASLLSSTAYGVVTLRRALLLPPANPRLSVLRTTRTDG